MSFSDINSNSIDRSRFLFGFTPEYWLVLLALVGSPAGGKNFLLCQRLPRSLGDGISHQADIEAVDL